MSRASRTPPPLLATAGAAAPSSRVLCEVESQRAGPLLLALAGIHGNEPAGIEAVERVRRRLEEGGGLACGAFVALAGNLQALERRVRYVHHDLNRRWTEGRVREFLSRGEEAADCSEDREQVALIRELESRMGAGWREVYFVDLHTSSAPGPPFLTQGDTLRNRRLAEAVPLPRILGLEEQVDGSLLEYLNNRGFVTVGAEGGAHDDPVSVDHLESVLWLALAGCRMVDPGQAPFLAAMRATLAAAAAGVPRIVEVRHRHPVRPDEGFRMLPGFRHFQWVARGTQVARDRRGPIRVPEDGLLLLPLYQGQGDDGFFLGREVRPFWLALSSLLRRTGLAARAHWLPGIRRHPRHPERLVVDTRIARYLPLHVFHLLGYRKVRRMGDVLVVTRRRFDLAPPRRYTLEPDLPE